MGAAARVPFFYMVNCMYEVDKKGPMPPRFDFQGCAGGLMGKHSFSWLAGGTRIFPMTRCSMC